MRPPKEKRARVLGMPKKQIYSVPEAAAFLGVTPCTVHRRIARGLLIGYPCGRSFMLLRRDL